MSTNKADKRRKPGEFVYSRAKPGLRFPKPPSGCATTDLITELSREVMVMIRARERRRGDSPKDEPPEAV